MSRVRGSRLSCSPASEEFLCVFFIFPHLLSVHSILSSIAFTAGHLKSQIYRLVSLQKRILETRFRSSWQKTWRREIEREKHSLNEACLQKVALRSSSLSSREDHSLSSFMFFFPPPKTFLTTSPLLLMEDLQNAGSNTGSSEFEEKFL